MKKIIFSIILILISNAHSADILCSYNFDNEELQISTNTSFPIKKDWKNDNLNYSLFLKDAKFNEIEDYLVIENNKGYKITYSLKCKKT